MNNKSADQTGQNAQAGLRLCCLQIPKDRFSGVEAQVLTLKVTITITSTNFMTSNFDFWIENAEIDTIELFSQHRFWNFKEKSYDTNKS